jgi:biopolymer transport protein ExbB
MYHPLKSSPRVLPPIMARVLLAAVILGAGGLNAFGQGAGRDENTDSAGLGGAADAASVETGGFDTGTVIEGLVERGRSALSWLAGWYERTPPSDRVIWGGLTACAGLGVFVLLERLVSLRRKKVVPAEFVARFLDKLHDARLDWGQALDHCELNPTPAGRVALAAVRRWGRPAADLERAVALAHRVEADRLRRNVGTLRRVAALAPLVGLLGTLFALGSALDGISFAAGLPAGAGEVAGSLPAGGAPLAGVGHALAAALAPLTAGVLIAALSLVAYDGLLIRIEKLAGALDRFGLETIDGIALAATSASQPTVIAHAPLGDARRGPIVHGVAAASGTPHQGYLSRDGAAEQTRRGQIPAESGF